MSLVIAGGSGGTNVGDSFLKASQDLRLNPTFLNTGLAYKGSLWLRRLNWHLRGRHPIRLSEFSQKIVHTCSSYQSNYLLTTGLAPIDDRALTLIGQMGIQRLNFLTDDPWNPAHRAPWFFRALPHYDIVFSPRRANLKDLEQLGCRQVEYLPFGYEPKSFFPDMSTTSEQQNYKADVVFAGGADHDRVPYLDVLIQAGLRVSLYGSYWERYPETRPYTHGQADLPTLRKAISSAKVALCLVRRANRDGHCMRTFEVPAIGACMLTEDTPEHREIFGAEGEAVLYFSTLNEMVEKTHWLISHDVERQQLAKKAHQLITQGRHTYRDRLQTMLSIAST